MTLQQPKTDFRPSVASMDYNDHLRTAYYDCVVALNSFQAASENIPQVGINRFAALLATERFVGCVKILDKMITDNMKDDTFKTAEGQFWKSKNRSGEDLFHHSLDLYHEITELFVRKGIWKMASTFMGRL